MSVFDEIKQGLGTDIPDDIDTSLVLTDENGEETKFEFLDYIEYNGEEFVVLLPAEVDSDEVVILKIESISDSDEEAYSSVDDESVLEALFEIFKERFKDSFDFVD